MGTTSIAPDVIAPKYQPPEWDVAYELEQRLTLITSLAKVADGLQTDLFVNRLDQPDERELSALTDFVARHLVMESAKARAQARGLSKRLGKLVA